MGTGKKGISRVNQNGGVYKQIMQELQMTGLLSLSGNSETSLPFITFNFAKKSFSSTCPPPRKVKMGKMGGGGVAWTSKSPLFPHDPVDSNLHPTCILTELGLLQSIRLKLI